MLSLLCEQRGYAIARCAFFLAENQLISPQAASFGAIELTKGVSDPALDLFWQALETTARQAGMSSIRLTHPPRCYAPAHIDRLIGFLTQHGFRVVEQPVTFYLPVTPLPLIDRMHASERRRLRKCQRAGFQFKHWSQPCIDTVVNYITDSRQQQGFALTLPIDRLRALLTDFPEKFLVFVVLNGSVMTTLTIAVRVSATILYSFLPADNLAYRTYSPAVMLIEGLYRYCQQQQIALLDLGVALDANQQPKLGLVRFKQNMGALPSPKQTLAKEW